jgi:hypothetical protein
LIFLAISSNVILSGGVGQGNSLMSEYLGQKSLPVMTLRK